MFKRRCWLASAGILVGFAALTWGLLTASDWMVDRLIRIPEPQQQPVAYLAVGVAGLLLGLMLARVQGGFPHRAGLLISQVVWLRLMVRDDFTIGSHNLVELLIKFEVFFACLYFAAFVLFLTRGAGLFQPVFVGFRYLKHKMVAGLSTVGVALGVAAMIVVLSVMSGFELDMQNKVIGANAQVIFQKRGLDFDEYRIVAAKVERVDGVAAVSPFVYNEVMLSSASGSVGVFLKGVQPETAGQVISVSFEKGEFGSLTTAGVGERAPILLGSDLREKLGVELGGIVKAISPLNRDPTTGRLQPRAQEFRVAGWFHTGMYEYDAKSAMVSMHVAQRFFDLGKSITGLAIRSTDLRRLDQTCARIMAAVDGYPYFTRTWKQMNRELFSALRMQKIAMFIILVVVVLVSAFGVVATLIMLVWEKVKEIAILKSMGATGAGVMKIFMIEGLTIGAAGTFLGVLLGWAACWVLRHYGWQLDPEVYFIERLPVEPNPLEFALVAGIALHISLMATVYPSLRAARLAPVDGLRYD